LRRLRAFSGFQQPAAFHEKVFCGTAYRGFETRMHLFYPARPNGKDDDGAYDYALILTGLSLQQEQQIEALPPGSALRIVGTLNTSDSCTNPPRADVVEECTPIKHPFYIDKAQFSRE
jgi:hypothetical protein